MRSRLHRVAKAARALAVAIGAPAIGLATATLAAQAQQALDAGRVAGQIVDAGTGRSVNGARVFIAPVGQETGVMLTTDLDGRFRSRPIPVGDYSLRVSAIGYRPAVVSRVTVAEGSTNTLNLAIEATPFELEELVVQGAAEQSIGSDIGLLAARKNAQVVADGISAETISRNPDKDASDAVVRIPGVSVVQDKFVIVRGLTERYNSTLLNETEVASPEPVRKIVPLNIFPSKLLESIITIKTATPAVPGDFTGGLVQINTKQFPEETVADFELSTGFNSVTTFESYPMAGRSFSDLLGFDNGRRARPPSPAAQDIDPDGAERFIEAVRNVWTPPARSVDPSLGLRASLGTTVDIGEADALGGILSFTYSNGTQANPDRFYAFVTDPSAEPLTRITFREASRVVDWGLVGNVGYRFGGQHTLGWNNFYTRNAEEYIASSNAVTSAAFNPVNRRFQVRYIERVLYQSQLVGDHLFPFLGNARVEWRATYSQATRDEPDNRTATYRLDEGTGQFRQTGQDPANFFFRFLKDETVNGQGKVSMPLSLRRTGDALVQVGGLLRLKDRDFQADQWRLFMPSGDVPEAFLPPEEAFSPENVGDVVTIDGGAGRTSPYTARDDITALFGMVEVEVVPGARLVGGVRMEDWRLDIHDRREEAVTNYRRDRDWLPSANLNIGLSSSMNLRLAGFRSVARPDPRELSVDTYAPIGGECTISGNPDVQRAAIWNGNIRWEMFPGAGQVIAVSGFLNDFDQPIAEEVTFTADGNCQVRPINGKSARNLGAEFELRTNLGFVPGVTVGGNLTLVDSEFEHTDERIQVEGEEIPLAGQSPWLVNFSLGYAIPSAGFETSLLVNGFGNRVARYGIQFSEPVGDSLVAREVPDVEEEGRWTLDLKVKQRLSSSSWVSLTGRNLTNARTRFFQGPVTTGLVKPGVQLGMAFGYEF